MYWKEKRLKRYFRYHHFRPLVAFNRKFNSVLGSLEAMCGMILCETGDDKESWKEILDGINSLERDDIDDLYRIMIEEKSNV